MPTARRRKAGLSCFRHAAGPAGEGAAAGRDIDDRRGERVAARAHRRAQCAFWPCPANAKDLHRPLSAERLVASSTNASTEHIPPWPSNQARSEPSICTSRPDTRVAGAADAGRAGVVADRAKGPAAITPHARSRARSCSRGAPPASPLPGPAKNRHTGSRAIDSARLRMASKRSQEPAAPSTEEVLSKHRGKPTPRRVR
jgi:hypothetical protein